MHTNACANPGTYNNACITPASKDILTLIMHNIHTLKLRTRITVSMYINVSISSY